MWMFLPANYATNTHAHIHIFTREMFGSASTKPDVPLLLGVSEANPQGIVGIEVWPD